MAWPRSPAESASAGADPLLADPGPLRFWGWSEPRRTPMLSERALAQLRELVGISEHPSEPVALEQVQLPPPALEGALAAELREIVGAAGLADDHATRVAHAAGKGYRDLVRMRAGAPGGAPDAVIAPDDHEQALAVLALCSARSVAVVPFGGGTSVVGGLEPLRGHHAALISLDTARMARVLDLDRRSRIVSVQAGLRAPALERALASEGLTLGHFPQSYHHVTLGGCAATRSSGQASSGYGSIAEMVCGLRLAAPAGELRLAAMPASAAGPDLRELALGSEGTLGLISELDLRVRPRPAERSYAGVVFRTFQEGIEAVRALAQERAMPAVVRLSDEAETRLSLALSSSGAAATRALGAYLRARGYSGGALALVGFEGTAQEVGSQRSQTLGRLRGLGAMSLGAAPGRAWARGRFDAPYLRDELLSHGVMAETLETATRWANVSSLHAALSDAIAGALAECGTPGLVMGHVSHTYETGASLYFTLLARQRPGEEIEQWQAVKRAAGEAILAGGGTITHHHAVGIDHLPWIERELGASGVAALAAAKAALDPNSIMNPGKLLPEELSMQREGSFQDRHTRG